MSPIRRGIEARFPRVGYISVGHQTVSKKGKLHPTVTDTFTFHCDQPEILRTVAEHLGGEVTESPTSTEDKERWYLVTNARELTIAIASTDLDRVFSQWYETWGSSGLQRRCDGIDCMLWRKPPEGNDKVGDLSDEVRPCICDADSLDEAKRCQPVVRFDLIVPEFAALIRRVGVWTFRSTGYFTNSNLKGDLELIHTLVGALGPAVPLLLRVTPTHTRRGDRPTVSVNLATTPAEALELAAASGRPALSLPTVEASPELEEPVGRIIDQPTDESKQEQPVEGEVVEQISPKQRAEILRIAKARKIPDDYMKLVLNEDCGGATTLADLNSEQADWLIEHLQQEHAS